MEAGEPLGQSLISGLSSVAGVTRGCQGSLICCPLMSSLRCGRRKQILTSVNAGGSYIPPSLMKRPETTADLIYPSSISCIYPKAFLLTKFYNDKHLCFHLLYCLNMNSECVCVFICLSSRCVAVLILLSSSTTTGNNSRLFQVFFSPCFPERQ